ncbi:MAG: hypothetical protein NT036_03235, partial [Candidatus Omnitrophica bacterium]|nr:hypothetical protein [Candidatus Omnitrophota bacterium]
MTNPSTDACSAAWAEVATARKNRDSAPFSIVLLNENRALSLFLLFLIFLNTLLLELFGYLYGLRDILY